MRDFNISTRIANRYRGSAKKPFSRANVPNLIQLELNLFVETFDTRMPIDCDWELYLEGKVHIDHRQSIEGCKANHVAENECWHWSNLWPLNGRKNSGKGGARGDDTGRVWSNEKNRWIETSEEDENLIKQCINHVTGRSQLLDCTA